MKNEGSHLAVASSHSTAEVRYNVFNVNFMDLQHAICKLFIHPKTILLYFYNETHTNIKYNRLMQII